MSTILYFAIPGFLLFLILESFLTASRAGEVKGFTWKDTAAR